MQIEALQLLKDQLSDHFVDKYEDFQSLFNSNCSISELAQQNTSLVNRYVDDAYTLYPETKGGGNPGGARTFHNPHGGRHTRQPSSINDKSNFSTAAGTLMKNYQKSVGTLGDSPSRPYTSPVIQLITEQKEAQKMHIPQLKRLSNNQEYQMLMKYQQVISAAIETIFEAFVEQVKDPKFASKHKDLLLQGRQAFNLEGIHHLNHGLGGGDSHLASLEVVKLKKQIQDMKVKQLKSDELINNLRKQYLKELITLREAHSQGAEKLKETLSVSFFDVTDGIDCSIVEILNLRLADMSKQFNSQIDEKTKTIFGLQETIAKYKRLAPKTFKLMELPLGEIFYSLSVVESDAAKVWNALLKNFPPGHFDGVIEDMYGGKMTDAQEKKIQQELDQTLKDCHKDVHRQTERLMTVIREKDFQLKQKVDEICALKELHQHDLKNLTEDLRMQFEMKLRDLEKLVNSHYAKEIQGYKDRDEMYKKEKTRLKNEINLLQKQKFFLRMQNIGRLMVQYRKEEEEGGYAPVSQVNGTGEGGESPTGRRKVKEKKVFRIEREEVASQFYEKTRQLVLGSDISRMQAKLDLRKEMMKDYKEKYEKTTQQLYELKLQHNEQIDDYDILKQKHQEQIASLNQLQAYNQSLIKEIQKLTHEVEILREANRSTLQMVKNTEKQKQLLEEKYNCQLEQNGDEFVLKRKPKSLPDDKRSLSDKIMDRLETELHGAYNAIEMSIHSQQLFETKSQGIKTDADTQTVLKNIHLKITQEQANYSNRKKQILETGIDEYCQTKIKAEQFDFYVKQQQIEKERLEKRLNKLRDKDADEIDLAELLMRDDLVPSKHPSHHDINTPPNNNASAQVGSPHVNDAKNSLVLLPGFGTQEDTKTQAEMDQQRIDRAQKQMLDELQAELSEKTDALTVLLGARQSVKVRGPRKRRNIKEETDEETSEEEESDEENESALKKRKKESPKKKSIASRSSKKSMAGFDSARILNIKNGKLQNFPRGSNGYHGGNNNGRFQSQSGGGNVEQHGRNYNDHGAMNGSEGDSTSRFHPDVLRDPRYLQKSMEFAMAEDGNIQFPKLEDFNFDREKYERALAFLKNSLNSDIRRKISKEQAERLYPLKQPEVFKRLIQNTADAIIKFDRKLKEIQNASQQSWIDRLQSQKFISEEQLLVLGGASSKAEEGPSTHRILKVMDQMLKIGSHDTQSPRLMEKSGQFLRVKGIQSKHIFATGKRSKLKLVKTDKKKSANPMSTCISRKGSKHKSPLQVESRVRKQSEGGADLILLKDDNDIETIKERKRKLQELLSQNQSRGASSSNNRRQIQQILNTTSAETPGTQVMIGDSINKESTYTLDSSRVHKMIHRLQDSDKSPPIIHTANVSLDATTPTKQLRMNIMSSKGVNRQKNSHKRNHQESLLQGFIDKTLATPAVNQTKYQNQDLNFSMSPQSIHPLNRGLSTKEDMTDLLSTPNTQDGGDNTSVLKNKFLSTPSTPQYHYQTSLLHGNKTLKPQSRGGMEIFSHEQSLEKRMQYQMPRSIHALITDINHKNNVELHNQSQVIKQQEAILLSKRRKQSQKFDQKVC